MPDASLTLPFLPPRLDCRQGGPPLPSLRHWQYDRLRTKFMAAEYGIGTLLHHITSQVLKITVAYKQPTKLLECTELTVHCNSPATDKPD